MRNWVGILVGRVKKFYETEKNGASIPLKYSMAVMRIAYLGLLLGRREVGHLR